MKYKKLVIILSIVIGVIGLGFLLSYTLFGLNCVQINFKSQTTLFASQEDKQTLVSSGSFSFGSPIFFINKQQNINNIEKSHPDIKVVNIESVFPNKLVVHVAEREKLFVVQIDDEQYYICDEELKILSYNNMRHGNVLSIEDYLNSRTNALLLDGVDIIDKTAKPGDYLTLHNAEKPIKKLANAFAYNNRSIADINAMFKKITLTAEFNFYTKNSEDVLIFTTFDNFNVKIFCPEYHLIEKLNFMLSLLPQSAKFYKSSVLVINIDPFNTNNIYVAYEPIE